MNKRTNFRSPLNILLSAFVLLLLIAGCEIQSGNETVRNVTVRVAGTYVNENGLPGRQSGARTTRLTLTQSGDQLFGVDEHNIRWNGTITRAEGTSGASFNLNGSTTAGGRVTLTGEIRIDGSTARMSGLWVEPGFTSSLSAEATVTPAPEPTPTPAPEPTPTPAPTTGGSTNGPTLVISNP